MTVPHMTDLANLRDAVPLAGTGVRVAAALHANLTAPALVAHSLRKNEGRLSAHGAVIVRTGVHTGRSVGDKFVVDEPSTTENVWWGKVNQKLPEDKFATLKSRVQAYLQGRELFTQDLYAGADPVSYTHLDVYKRQFLRRRFTWLSMVRSSTYTFSP